MSYIKNVRNKKIEEEYDLEILKLLEQEEQEYDKVKKIKLKIGKKEMMEKFHAKNMSVEIEELKEIETKLEELDIKIFGKRYKNETRDFKVLIEQEIELETKKQKTEDGIKEYKILIDKMISEAED